MSRSSSATSGIAFQPSEPRSKVTLVCATAAVLRDGREAQLLGHGGADDRRGAALLGLGQAVHRGELGGVLLDGREVVLRQAAVAVVDDDGGDGVGVLERLEPLEGPGRLRRLRQPRGGLVVLHVGQLGGEARGADRDQQPDDEHDPLGDPPGERAGELTVHGHQWSSPHRQCASGIPLTRAQRSRPLHFRHEMRPRPSGSPGAPEPSPPTPRSTAPGSSQGCGT